MVILEKGLIFRGGYKLSLKLGERLVIIEGNNEANVTW